jgi:nucleoside-diphosphate-sugar epimerase
MESEPLKIFATGGTGTLGRAVVRRLVAIGRHVQILSRRGNLPAHPQVSICRGDIRSLTDLRAAMRGCSAVFHCAGEKNDAGTMREINVSATKLLFDLACDLQVGFFCHLSSVGVIGRTHSKVVDETAPCNPMNLYEETKLAAEEIVNRGIPGGNVVILRPTNIFSAETLKPCLESSVRFRARLFLKGNENSHLVYVEDVAAAAVHWIQHSCRKAVDMFIVSSDEEDGNTHREVQASLASKCPAAPRPFKIAAPLFIPHYARLIKSGNSNVGDVVYSSRKLREAGFTLPYGLRRGLDDAVSELHSRPS